VSFLLLLNQSNESANMTNWLVEGKRSEINYILTNGKAFLLLVAVDVISIKFLSLFHFKQTPEVT